MHNLKTDPEFRDKIPPLTPQEFDQLRENILADGEVYEPIIVWNGVIVDGHNRWKIIQENPGIPYKVKEMHFADKYAAFTWMYQKQLGRRNLSDENRTYIIGKMYEAKKKSVGAQKGNKNAEKQNTQNANIVSGGRTPRTDEIIAAEIGVNHSTVIRSEKFSKGVDAVREQNPEAAAKILHGGTGVTKKDVASFPTMEPEQKQDFISAIVSGTVKERKPKHNGGNRQNREIAAAVNKAVDGLLSGADVTITVTDVADSLESSLIACAHSIRNTLEAHGYDPNGEYKDVFMSAVERGITKVKEIFQ